MMRAVAAGVALLVGLGVVMSAPEPSRAADSSVGYVKCEPGSQSPGEGSYGTPWTSLAAAEAALEVPGSEFSGLRFKPSPACVGTLRLPTSGVSKDAPFVLESEIVSTPVTLDGGGSGGALILDDVSNVTVRNMVFTNNGPAVPGSNAGVAAVRVRAVKRPVSNITFDAVTFHSVNCPEGKCNDALTTDPIDAPHGSATLAALSVVAVGPRTATVSDVTVTTSTFDHAGLYGIKTWSVWNERDKPGEGEPIRRLRVEKSAFDHTPGGAAVLGATDGAVFKGNTVDGFAENPKFTSAGLFPYYATNTTISRNTFRNGGGGPVSSCAIGADHTSCNADGQAIDLDGGSVNTLVEHNLSMNNARGFLMMCRASKSAQTDADRIKNAVVRFNRSYGDGGYGIRLACGGNVHGIQIYNNAWVLTSDASDEPFQFISNTESRPDVLTQQPLNWGNDLRVINNTVTNLGGVQVRSSVFATDLHQNTYSAASNTYDGAAGTLSEPTASVTPAPNTTIHPARFLAADAPPVGLCGEARSPETGWGETATATDAWRTCTDPDQIVGTAPPKADWVAGAGLDAFDVEVDAAAPLIGVDQAPFLSTTAAVVAGPRPMFSGFGHPGASVEVKGASRTVCVAEVQSDRHWRCDSVIDLAPDTYNLYATQRRGNADTAEQQIRIPVRVQ